MGVTISKPVNDEESLRLAVRENKFKLVQDFLTIGVDPNTFDSEGRAAFHYAVRAGVHEMKVILNGSRYISLDKPSKSAFREAVSAAQKMMKLLVDFGSDPNALEGNGFGAVHYLSAHVRESHVSAAMLKNLSSCGADFKTLCARGLTALHWAACDLHKSDKPKRVVCRLLKYGSDVNQLCARGVSPLHVALYHFKANRPAVFQVLIVSGANVSAKDYMGRLPVSIALNMQRTQNMALPVCLLVASGCELMTNFARSEFVTSFYEIEDRKRKKIKCILMDIECFIENDIDTILRYMFLDINNLKKYQ
jgi:ankyrin repeat protein